MSRGEVGVYCVRGDSDGDSWGIDDLLTASEIKTRLAAPGVKTSAQRNMRSVQAQAQVRVVACPAYRSR